ncbi:H-NS histone family protein (plasmid) [Massilia varians]
MADGIEDEAPEDKELLSAMEELERAKQRVDQLRAQHRAKAITDVREKIKMYGLTADELGFVGISTAPAAQKPSQENDRDGVDRRSQVKPKYRSPSGSETWSGRGKAPLWLRVLLDQGHNKEEFEISEVDLGSAK